MKTGSSRSARQQILDTAAELFFRDGYRVVGVDTIIERSGVAKMTLYRHFPSKNDLIAAYLEYTNTLFWEWFEQAVQPYPDDPRAQLVAVFESLEKMVTSPTCYGCPFLRVATEFPEAEHPGHQVAIEHKRAVLARFQEMAVQAGALQPQALATHLLLLMDGAYLQARMFGPDNPAVHVSQAARSLIDVHLGI